MDKYVSPLSERYASKEMQYIFSPDKKFRTWRRLWIALAETEQELELTAEDGSPRITDEMLEELRANAEDINYEVAEEREKIVAESIGNINGGCDGCMSGLADMYQDYIDGKREIREINMEYAYSGRVQG